MTKLTATGEYIGTRIYVDDWGKFTKIESLDSWERADFRITTGLAITTLAANVKITGRTWQYKTRLGGWAIRCKIVIVGDCEPDKNLGGWIAFDDIRMKDDIDDIKSMTSNYWRVAQTWPC